MFRRTSSSMLTITLVLSCTSSTSFLRDSIAARRVSVSPIARQHLVELARAARRRRCGAPRRTRRSALLRALISWTPSTSLRTASTTASRSASRCDLASISSVSCASSAGASRTRRCASRRRRAAMRRCSSCFAAASSRFELIVGRLELRRRRRAGAPARRPAPAAARPSPSTERPTSSARPCTCLSRSAASRRRPLRAGASISASRFSCSASVASSCCAATNRACAFSIWLLSVDSCASAAAACSCIALTRFELLARVGHLDGDAVDLAAQRLDLGAAADLLVELAGRLRRSAR